MLNAGQILASNAQLHPALLKLLGEAPREGVKS